MRSAGIKNVGTADRLLRVLISEICIIIGFFWASRDWQILLYLIAAVMLFQAATGMCGWYRVLKINTCEIVKRDNKNIKAGFLAIIVLLGALGIYAGSTMTRQAFQDDIGRVGDALNQTLISAEGGSRQESISNYDNLSSALDVFNQKYSDYRPLAIKSDDLFSGDMENVTKIVSGAKEEVYHGNLTLAGEELKDAGPILMSILRRNGL